MNRQAVVADAGPLIALAKLNRLELLDGFFNEVLIPEAVASNVQSTRPARMHNVSKKPLTATRSVLFRL